MTQDLPNEWGTADTGPGSVREIISYITTVISERTTPNPGTDAAKLARGITFSVLNRLRDTSDLAVRADELHAEYRMGYLDASEKYGAVGSLRDAVDDCLARLNAAVEELRAEPNATEETENA